MKSFAIQGLTSVLVAVMLALASTLTLAQSREVIDEVREVGANERITLEIQRGEVVIRPGSDNSLRIRGELDPQAEGFELRSNNGFTQFEVVMPRNIRNRDSDNGSDLEITVPANSEIEVRGVNLNVDIANVAGGVRITTVNGDIRAEGLREFVQLQTVNGAIHSENNQDVIELETVNANISDNGSQGRMTLRTVNGIISVDNNADELQMTMVNGEIDALLSGTQSLQFSSVNGSVEIRLRDSVRPRIRGSSVSGDIRLQLDSAVDARFDVQTNVGRRIENEITEDEAQEPRFGPGRSLQFMTGTGLGSVDISTVSGGIRLQRN